MKKLHALFATLFAATSVVAASGDIAEIRPCDAYGNSTAHPQTTIYAPMTSGENLYFNIRLVSREQNRAAEPESARSFFELYHNPYAGTSEEYDAAVNPLKIGIVVSGKTRWASLVKFQKTPSVTEGVATLHLTDLIFEYHTEPGDFALPIKLAADDQGTPVGEDDSGASYILRNDNKWKVQYHDKNGVVTDAALIFNPNPTQSGQVTVADKPESDLLNSNWSLKDCGFYVQTVDFEQPWATETAWRTVQQGVTVKGRVEVVAPVTNAVTLYVWSQDESVAVPVGSNVSKVKMTVPDASGKPVSEDVMVATIKIAGGQSYGEFYFKGVTQNSAANFVLSGFKGYNWTGAGSAEPLLITDFTTAPVACTEPPPPYVELALEGDETTVVVPVNQKKSVAQFNLSLSSVWEGGDGKVRVTVSPMAKDASKIPDIFEYVHISDTLNETTAWNNDGTVTLEFDTQATTPVLTQPVYVYALGGCKDTSDESSPVYFRVVKIEPAAAATYYGTIKDQDFLYFKPAAADIVEPAADETINAVGGVARELTFKLDDNYFNRNDRATGYQVYWCQDYAHRPAESRKLGDRWALKDGVLCKLNDDGTVDESVLPSVTYNVSGDYTAAFRFVGPNDEPTPGTTIRDWRTVKVRVSDPATVSLTLKNVYGEVSKTYDEGDNADATVTLSSPYDEDLYAFLKPSKDGLVTGDCVVGSDFSLGVYIMAGSLTSEDDFGRITFQDGEETGTAISFDVVLCTSEEYDPSKVVQGYKSAKQTVRVNNVKPTTKDVYMNVVNKLVKRGGDMWMNGTASINVEKTFTFKVVDPAIEADLNATGDDQFQLQWTVEENVDEGGITKGDVIYGNPNKQSLKYTFSQPGKAKVTIALMDKDMKKQTGEFGDPLEFFITITDYPSVYVEPGEGLAREYAENAVGAKYGKMTVRFSENPASIPLDVEIAVSAIGESANPGKLILAGCTPVAGKPNVYALTVPKGQRYFNIYIDDADGTADSANKGFYVVPRVTTESENPEGVRWCDYFSSEAGDPFFVMNVAPALYTSTVMLTTPLRGECGTQNTTTNAYVAAIGEADPITWSVSDIMADLGKKGSTTNITVKWTSEGRKETFTVNDEADYTFVPVFKSAGEKTVTVTVTDKDEKAGGTTTASWYYTVQGSKQLTTLAHGPRGTSGTQISNRYANQAKGIGEGRTYVDASFSLADGWALTWNCARDKSVLCYAWGYKVGDVDDGTLTPAGKDVKLDTAGCNNPSMTFTDCYAYPDKERDSFFYRWLPVEVSDEAGELSAFSSLAPEKPATGTGSLSLPLPTEEDAEGGYKSSKLEALFAKEFLASDNMGDINQDGIPDAYVGAYLFDVVDEGGALVGNDLADLSQRNDDGDYLPANFTAGAAAFIPGGSNTWVMTGREFAAKYEIRGFYDEKTGVSSLNNAPELAGVKGVKPEVRYTDPATDAASTLSELEWDAYVQAGQPDGWSPERPTDPTKADTDGDGLPDGYEYYIWYKATVGWFDNDGNHLYLTGRRYNPRNPFAPTEISPEELAAKFDPLKDGSINWDKEDTDNDGIVDSVEFMLGTNPYDYDTDRDGLPDGFELYFSKTDPLKYATDDEHCDATLNDYGPDEGQGDAMAEYETQMKSVGVLANDGSIEYFGCDAADDFAIEATLAADKVALLRIVSTNTENKVATNLYVTTKNVVTKDGVLIGDYGRASTFVARYDDEGRLMRGAPTKLVRGTLVSEVVKDQEYYDETVTFPATYYVLWVCGQNNDGSPVLARGQKTGGAPSMNVVCAAAAERKVKVQHYYVRRTKPFSPHTGWKDKSGPVDSRTFTHMDEFLVMTFFYRAGALTEGDLTPTDTRSMVAIWKDFTTSPVDADTDGDNMPDGWELYVMGGTADLLGAGPGPADVHSPITPFSRARNIDRDNDTDYLPWDGEYSGTKSSAYYSSMCPSIFQLNTDWRNKAYPTDPWNADTDGDGVLDGEEGGKYPNPPPDSSYGLAVRQYFMFNSSGMAGGGLNPLSWDTDYDGLPDPWEIEFHGTYTQGTATTSTTTSVDDAGKTNETTTTSYAGCTWNMDGMNGTVDDARIDYDHDGLANWQEYMAGAMRCWRYDDSLSGWGNQYSSLEELDAIMAQPGTEAWNQYWHDRLLDTENLNGKFNPHFANGFFDAGSAYFSCCTNDFDGVKGRFYMFRDGVYHEQTTKMTWQARFPGMMPAPLRYISCDPRNHDTDQDGMDDYYELFHGLNPLLGAPAAFAEPAGAAYDVVVDAYYRGFNDGFIGGTTPGFSALYNYWRNTLAPGDIKHPELDGWDFIAHPWLNGSVSADPDGDNVGNQEEAILPNVQAASTYHHTDPTPLWMTDTTYTNSLTRRYYRFNSPQGYLDRSFWSYMVSDDPTFEWEGVTYYLKNFPGFRYISDAKQLTFSYNPDHWGVYNGWEFSFEENEGYDSDHDYLSDFEEAQGKTKNASDPQDHDAPYRRQAMYFGGAANPSFLQTPVATYELEPDSPDASCEARQNFLYYTVECWAKPDADTMLDNNRLQTLVERAIWADNAGPADEKLLRKNFQLAIRNGRWYTRFDSTGTDKNQFVDITDGPQVTTNWTHLAATFDGTALRLYVNGVCNNVKPTTIQPEHGVNALSVSAAGEMNPVGGTREAPADYITILVGASAATQKGIVYDYAWRYRDGVYNVPDVNPEGMASDRTTFADYDSYYKGYIDEVRIWDGARSATNILADCQNRVRYTTEMALENRQAVYEQWKQGGLRSPASPVQLPPQLMYHWAFDHIPSAVLPTDVIQVPAGFNTAKTVTDAKARWVRPADYVEYDWNHVDVRSTVYADTAWVPWVNNTVAHLPRFDLTTLDSVYWSEDYAGHAAAGVYGYGSFKFPRTHEVYSRWTQQKYAADQYYDMNLDRDFAVWNGGGNAATSRSFTQRSRWDLIAGYGSTYVPSGAVSNLTEQAMAFRFALRDRNTVGDDLLPMGGAFARRISKAEGGMWDNPEGEDPLASDVWPETGKDSDNNGLPDWWEEYARANYCKDLPPKEPLTWSTEVTYRNGVKMPAYEAYLRDLAAGLVKIGDKIAYDPNYVDERDVDNDFIPDWWEEIFGHRPDADHDGLTDVEEGELGTDMENADSDGDGMPDGWEAKFADTKPLEADSDGVVDGDVMAFATVPAQLLTVGERMYALADGEKLPNVGDAPDGLSVYTTYEYPVVVGVTNVVTYVGEGTNRTVAATNRVVQLTTFVGIGTNLTLKTTERVTAVDPNGSVVLVHAQVYDRFGFDTTTATAAPDAKNTKPFTALDKYLVLRYLTALGLADEKLVNVFGVFYDRHTVTSSGWARYSLKPHEADYDADGIADGWELYVMFGPKGSTSVTKLPEAKISPWNYDDARDFSPDGKDADGTKREDVGMRLIDEYDRGNAPTDPWNVDTDGDNVIDKYAFEYHLKGGDAGEDFDGDGLSNYAEYLISEVFQFAKLDPENPKTDMSCVDYFRKTGDLYFGEIFTDHDQVNDAWEQENAAYANRDVYDPSRDDDEDGWSNYAEAKAGTHPGAARSIGADGEKLAEYPIPAIAAKVVFRGFHGKTALNGDLVFQAWSQKTDPDMTGVPDATWTASEEGTTNVTKYVGINPGKTVTYHLGTGVVMPGSLRVWFRDTAAENALFKDGVEVSTSRGTNPQWYYFVEDVLTGNGIGDLMLCATNVTSVKVGSIDYTTGLATIDFGCEALQGVVYDNWVNGTGGTTDDKSTGIPSSCVKIDLSRSFVKLAWTPVKVDAADSATYYLSDAAGHVREGLNKFVVFTDVNADGKYTPEAGELFGFVQDVDVGWQGGAFTVELTETSPVFARVDLVSGQSDRAYWQPTGSSLTDISDSKSANLKAQLGVSTTNLTSNTGKMRVRVVRALVDHSATMGTDAEKKDVKVDQTVVMDKYLDLAARSYLHEGDFLADGSYDVDWKYLQAELAGRPVLATNVSYMIVLGEGGLGLGQTIGGSNTIFRCLIDRVYDLTGNTVRPSIDATQPGMVYGARPTFRWTMGSFNSYTAFRVQIASGGVAYDSGLRTVPARDADGWYSWTLDEPIGTHIKTSGEYRWTVTMYNAKFQAGTTSASGVMTVNLNNQQDMNDHGYSSVAACVKYTGPETVLSKMDGTGTKGLVRLEAFTTADFAGDPAGATYVTGEDAVKDSSDMTANALVCGLPQNGTYYLRAFVDSNGNGAKDDFESWGAAAEPVTLSKDVLTIPTVGIYIEDADTDGDWIPDAYEYAKAGWGGDWASVKGRLNGSVEGYDRILFSGTVSTAGISTGLSGASLTIFQDTQSFIVTALGLGDETRAIGAIRAAVEKNVNPKTVKITALSLTPDGKSVTIGVSAEVTDSVAGALLGKVYDLTSFASETAAVTIHVYKKETLASSAWVEVGTGFPAEIGKDEAKVSVPVSGVDMKSGFYKVEIEQ